MAGFAIYALVKTIGKDWRIGLVAAFLITFVTKMPGYYLSWGALYAPDRHHSDAGRNGRGRMAAKGKREWWQALGFGLWSQVRC